MTAHDPYQLQWTDWRPASQYFSQSLSLSGSAPYVKYFSQPKNRVFEPYQNADSLALQAEAAVTSGSTDNWKISVSHNLFASKNLFDPSSDNLRFDLSCKITDNWSLNYGNYYDLKTKNLITQTLSVTRDLHCWKLEVSYSRRNEFWEYRVALFNTALPDALRFQTHDSKRY